MRFAPHRSCAKVFSIAREHIAKMHTQLGFPVVACIVAQRRRVAEQHAQRNFFFGEMWIAKLKTERVANVRIQIQLTGFHQTHHAERRDQF